MACLGLVFELLCGCASADGPPRGRYEALFEAFAPRPRGQVGATRWIGDGSEAASVAEEADAGPRVVEIGEVSLVPEGGRGSFLVRFDGATCPELAGGPAPGEAAIRASRRSATGWVEVAGESFWRSDRLLAFQAHEAWNPATRYRFEGPRVPCAGAQVGTAPPADEGRWTREEVFEPLRISVAGTDHRRIPANAAIELHASHPVPVDALRQALSLTRRPLAEPDSAEGSPLPFTVAQLGPPSTRGRIGVDYALRPAGRDTWPADSMIELRIDGALRSEAGPEPLGDGLRTHRGVAPALHFTAGCDEDCDPTEPLRFAATRALAKDELARVRVHPHPPGLARRANDLTHDRATQSAQTVEIRGRMKPGQRVRVTFPAGLRDAEAGQLEATQTFEIQLGRVDPVFGFDSYEGEDGDGQDDEEDEGPEWNQQWSRVERPSWFVQVLDAARPLTLGVFGRRIEAFELRVAAIDPVALPKWLGDDDLEDLPWPQADEVGRSRVPMRPRGPTEFASQALDLRPVIGEQRGLFVVEIEAVAPEEILDPDHPMRERALVMVTGIAPTVARSLTRTTVQVHPMTRGAGVSGATVRMVAPGAPDSEGARRPELVTLGVTDASGALSVRSEGRSIAAPAFLVVDTPGGDRAVLPLDDDDRVAPPTGSLTRLGEELRGKLVTDRGIYRPGDTLHVMGWTVIHSPWSEGRLRATPEGSVVRVELVHERLGPIASRDVKTGAHGKLSVDFALEDTMVSGNLRIDARALGGESRISGARVKAEDFRVPTFWTSSREVRPGTGKGTGDDPWIAHRVTSERRVRARAQAYSGGTVPVIAAAATHECRFASPSGHDYGLDPEWRVGDAVAGEADHALTHSFDALPTPNRPAADGEVGLSASFAAIPPGVWVECGLEVALTDLSLQTRGARTWLRALGPGSVIAAAIDDAVGPGAGELRLRAVDHRQARVALGRVRAELIAGGHNHRGEPETRTLICERELSAEGPDAICALPTVPQGRYTLEVTGPDGTRTRTSSYLGGKVRSASRAAEIEPAPEPEQRCEPAAKGEQCHYVTADPGFDSVARPRQLSVHPQFDHVVVGDTLRVALRGPWQGASGWLLVGEGGHMGRHPFVLRRGRAEVALPVDERWVGGVPIYAWLPRKEKGGTPRLETAQTNVSVSEASRTLDPRIELPERARAGDPLRVSVTVVDRDELPAAGGRVSLWMVDRAVLDLAHYYVPSLEGWLGPPGEQGSDTLSFTGDVVPPFVPRRRDPGTGWGRSIFGYGYGSGMGHGGGGAAAQGAKPPAGERVTRDRFAITPLFVADLPLDAKGRASTEITLPGNLTTFRLFAMASAPLSEGVGSVADPATPARYGRSQAELQVDLPLSASLAMPRQLRPGDESEVAGIVANRGSADFEGELRLRVHGEGIALAGPQVQPVAVPAGERVRVVFAVRAEGPGTPELELELASTGAEGSAPEVVDRERRPLPVELERLRWQHDGFSGHVDAARGTIKIPVGVPEGVDPAAVDVQVSLATSRLVDLGPVVRALATYPYGCTEQTASTLLPGVAASGPGLAALYPEAGAPQLIAAGVGRLVSRQREDGAFGYWSADSSVSPWASVYATWVLGLADRAGHPVPPRVLDRARAYLRTLVFAPDPEGWWPWQRETRNYALWVLADLDGPAMASDDELMDRLREQAEQVATDTTATPDERALMAYALARVGVEKELSERLLVPLRRAVTRSGGRAFVHPERLDVAAGDNFRSAARSAALALLALLEHAPEDPLIDALAEGLLSSRVAGDWGSTQANAFALLALDRWAAKRDEGPVSLSTRLWLSGRLAHEGSIQGPGLGLTRAEGELRAPGARGRGRDRSRDRSRTGVVLAVEGQGRAYFETRLTRLREVDERPPDRGLHLRATLRDADGPVAASARAGGLLALDIEVEADTATRWVVADVPIPAGLELVLTDLQGAGTVATLPGERAAWVSHQELRRDRAVIYGDELTPGVHRTTVFVRATAPGEYRWPGGRAQAMYTPGIEGWSAGTRLEVTAP